ncbi:class I SAM-dependent methyltransferase [Pseudoalteromonas tunicata]|uniref:class I SAM-dependent methyltransferase n=1 Tax=Pseudoalteromonas tunicata TaxID=314281 RepID=UPI00273EEAEA|nr:class I SAM-dependent methyltransferase [Pseudoalteromonas tunicata]MDP5212456.1 class I SAM-dependent methyltransferase [Pseudoalteromonas tunicata]
MMAWDETWEQIFSSREWGKYPGEDIIRFIARNFYAVEDRAAIKVLEVGCGPGANIWYLAREGFSVYAVEGSASAIEKAHNRLAAEVPHWQGELKVGDFLHLPFDDESFDAVIDIEAISCNEFEDSKKAYAEIARVLKPNGLLYSRAFAKGTLGDETGKEISYNCYLPAVGPMSGTGCTRFTAEHDLPILFAAFSSFKYGYQQNGDRDGIFTKEWTVTATK